MPLPIRRVNIDTSKEGDKGGGMDYSFLAQDLQTVFAKSKSITASNHDATVLYQIWDKCEKTEKGFKLDNIDVTTNDLYRLKRMGFIDGDSDSVTFTDKGKKIISTISLSEPSKFEGKKKEKSYHQILASMDKRGKKGYRIPKFASHNENCLNLKKSS